MLGWRGGTNCPGDLRPPHLGPGRGWGQTPLQGATMGRPPCLPSISQPRISLLPVPPLSFLPPFSLQSPPPSGPAPAPPESGMPGSWWEAAGEVAHLPALPAGLPEGTGTASVSLRAKRTTVSIPGQSSRVEAASSQLHHPERPCP